MARPAFLALALAMALACAAVVVRAYPEGAGSCDYPSASMGTSNDQGGNPQTVITVTDRFGSATSQYAPGEQYTVTVTRTGTQFVGWLLQAVKGTTATSQKGVNMLGTFQYGASGNTPNQEAASACSPTATAGNTQNTPTNLNALVTKWTAPATDQGSVTFHFTMVMSTAIWYGRTVPIVKQLDFTPVLCNGTAPPTLPQSFRAVSATNVSVTFSWAAPTCGVVTNYYLERDDGTGANFQPIQPVGTFAANVLQATADGLPNNGSNFLTNPYTFRLTAQSAIGFSQPVTFRAEPNANGAQPPAAPAVPGVSAITTTSALMSIAQPNLRGAALVSYTVMVWPQSNPAAATTQTVFSAVANITSLSAGTAYSASVAATSLVGTGDFSAAVNFSTTGGAGCPTCSGHGSCPGTAGVCVCDAGFLGVGCELSGFTGPVGDRITMTFAISGAHLYLAFTYAGSGYLGFGVGGDPDTGMGGMDALIITPQSGGSTGVTATVSRKYSTSQDTPNTFTGPGEDFGQVLSATGTVGTSVRVLVRRPLAGATVNRLGKSIGADEVTQVQWALGSTASFNEHTGSNRGKAEINFATGAFAAVPDVDRNAVYLIAFVCFLVFVVLISFSSLCCRASVSVRHMSIARGLNYTYLSNDTYKSQNACVGFVNAMSFDVWPALKAMTWGEFACVVLYGVAWAPFLALLKPMFDDAGRDFTNVLGSVTALLTAGALVLPTRNSIWTHLIGVPYERAIKYHRWIGRIAVIIMTAHGGTEITMKGWSTVLGASETVLGYGNVYGLIAWWFFAVPFLFTDPSVRRESFEVFLYTHVLIFAGIILAMLHSGLFFYIGIAPLALYLIDKTIRFFRPKMRVTKVISAQRMASGNATRSGATKLVLQVEGFTYEAGQYVFLNVPAVSWLAWHPFSISCAPGGGPAGQFSLHILDMGEGTFTHGIAKVVSELNSGSAAVTVDGPYGKLSVPALPDGTSTSGDDEGYRLVALVAGGVGVTPLMSVFLELYRRAKAANLSGGEAVGAWKSLKLVTLVWTCGNREAFDQWFGAEIAEVRAQPQVGGVTFTVQLFSTDSKSKKTGADLDAKSPEMKSDGHSLQLDVRPGGQTYGQQQAPAPAAADVKSGRPNFPDLLSAAVATAGVKATDTQVAVLTCGPESMIASVHAECGARGYHLHKETFFL